MENGIAIAFKLARRALEIEDRIEVDISNLIMSVRCGGSDATSGLVANPAAGCVADIIVQNGGTVMMSGTSEFLGARHLLMRRVHTDEVASRLHSIIQNVKEKRIRSWVEKKIISINEQSGI